MRDRPATTRRNPFQMIVVVRAASQLHSGVATNACPMLRSSRFTWFCTNGPRWDEWA